MLFRSRKALKSQVQKLDSLKKALGEELSTEEKAYLDRLESRFETELNFDDPASVEAKLRKREWEQLQKDFRPLVPLYQREPVPGETQAVKDKSGDPRDNTPQQNSYQNDPRYREYYERLRREGVQQSPSRYDEEVKPVPLDELDKTSWNSKPRRPSPTPATPPAAGGSPATSARVAPAPAQTSVQDADTAESGTIYRFDDCSVAVYKDAVSGKDYALFYFLEPNGAFVPRGIFLEQYERQKIGKLAPALFSQMIERKRWDRDAVIFHLDDYSFASSVPQPPAGAGGGNSSTATGTGSSSTTGSGYRSATATGAVHTPREHRPASQSDVHDSRSGRAGSGRRDALLERGRVLRVNVGGRVWESVYWTEDEIGPIVAHNTNKVWALMHLDLTRFRDSLEYGEVLSYDQLSEIEQSLASQR